MTLLLIFAVVFAAGLSLGFHIGWREDAAMWAVIVTTLGGMALFVGAVLIGVNGDVHRTAVGKDGKASPACKRLGGCRAEVEGMV